MNAATTRWRRILSVALFAAALCTWSQQSLAQVSGQSGIEGRVMDDTGALLPGVSVTISSPALQLPEIATVSDENGRYRFAGLPVGTYKVVFALSGFQSVSREELQVALGTIVTVDMKLQLGQLSETLTVRGQSPVVDVRTTTATTNLPKDLINALPTNRGVAELVKLAPGMREGTNYGASGAVSHTYDGVQARDTFRYPDVGTLEEVQVRAVGNDAEVATAGVNFIAAVKSGSNTFSGFYLGQWEGSKLQSSNLDDFLRSQGITVGSPRVLYRDLSADLGGRIVKDRLWFYTAIRSLKQKNRVIGFRGDAGPDRVFFTDDDGEGTSENQMNARTFKSTGQLTSRQKVNFLYLWEEQRGLQRGAGAFTTGESVGNYYLPNDLKKVEWTYTIGSRAVVNAFVGNTQWDSISLPYTDNPPAFDNVTRRITGAYVNSVGSDSTPAGSNSERWIYNSTMSYYAPNTLGGDHDIKVGFEATREWYDKFQHARGVGTGGVGNDFRLYFENGIPFEVLLYNSPFLSENNLNNQSFFARDNWLLNDRLTVSAGLRVERYHTFLPKQSKPAGPYSSAAEYAPLDIYKWVNLAPRLATSYALTADKRTVLKATWGRFNDVPAAQDARVFNQNDYFATRYKWTDLNNNGTYDDPVERGGLVATESAQGAGLKILNPDLEQAKQDEITVHVEREILEGFSIRTGYIYKRQFDQSQEVNPARPYEAYSIAIPSIDPGPDGVRNTSDDGGPITYYDYPASLRGPEFDQSKRVNTPGFTNRYHNIELSAAKRMSQRWQMVTSVLMTNVNEWRSGVPQTPNDVFPKNQYWEYTYKLSGSYVLPWDFQASGFYQLLSGAQYARTARFTAGLGQGLTAVTLNMEPVGSQQRPNQGRLDIKLDKRLRLGKGTLGLGVELYNVLNSNVVTNSSVISGPTYGRITAIMPARNARLTGSFRF
jgi:hypothetical protein